MDPGIVEGGAKDCVKHSVPYGVQGHTSPDNFGFYIQFADIVVKTMTQSD